MTTRKQNKTNRFSRNLITRRAGLFQAAVVAVLLGLGGLRARAVGFRLPNQDPEAVARGNAFVATADNPAAIYYNPAGITQLEGQNVSAAIYLISTSVKFDGNSGTSAKTSAGFQPVPQIYYVYTPKDWSVSFGLGIYAPYGLSLDWGDNGPFRNVVQNGSLLYATVNPVAAWKITPELSIAAGPTLNYSKADLNQGIGLVPNDQFHLVGDDTAIGFTAGARWQPLEQLSFGLNYRYGTTMNYRGHSSTSPSPPFPGPATSSSATIRFPQNVAAGISYRPTENWNIEFDIDWTDWDQLNQIDIRSTAFGNQSLPLNYRSTFMYDFGATRQLGNGYFVSIGYIYSENSIPDTFFSPLVPDSDLHLGSVGFGHRGQRWNWAAAYTVAVSPAHHVNNSVFGPSVDGTYRTFNNAINISVGLKF